MNSRTRTHLSDWTINTDKNTKIDDNCKTIETNLLNKTMIHEAKVDENNFGQLINIFSPCIQGLLFALLIGGIVLSAIINLWLFPRLKTSFIITDEIPPGTIIMFAGNFSILSETTHRWLLCDGSEVSRTIYADLFTVIGIMYGSGNGLNTFNLPDFRFRFPLGSNDSQLNRGGAASHTLTVPELPSHFHDQGSLQTLSNGDHSHSYTDPGHNHGGFTGSGPYASGSFSMNPFGGGGNDFGSHSHTIPIGTTGITIQTSGSHQHTIQGSTGSQGLNQPIDMMPPYQTIHYIIRA